MDGVFLRSRSDERKITSLERRLWFSRTKRIIKEEEQHVSNISYRITCVEKWVITM